MGGLFVRDFMSIRAKVRDLTTRYEQRRGFLQKEYKEELLILQAKCAHEDMTRWRYEIDTYGEVASTEEGVLIKYRECLDCGVVQTKKDDINDYDSEVEFCL
jgi:hypothetical protein